MTKRTQARSKRKQTVEKGTAAQRKGLGGGGSDPGITKKTQGLLRGNGRGRVTSGDDRQQFIQWINEVVAAGARRAVACREVNLRVRTWQRWQTSPEDRRTDAVRPAPAGKSSKYGLSAISQSMPACRHPKSYRDWRIKAFIWRVNRPFIAFCVGMGRFISVDAVSDQAG
ncbi:Uncharacterised protein [Serratia quinivorans]|jgi:hypothetical protein|nr:Uncharacterised protein [Serratia quinivorans]